MRILNYPNNYELAIIRKSSYKTALSFLQKFIRRINFVYLKWYNKRFEELFQLWKFCRTVLV